MKKIFLLIVAILLVNGINAQTEFWGTSSGGGVILGAAGTIYKTDNSGSNSNIVYNFYKDYCEKPTYNNLLQASNGKLYGMTSGAGRNIYEYDPITDVYKIVSGLDGIAYGTLIEASNGILYGLTKTGGVNSVGCLFQYDPSANTYTKLIDLSATTGNLPFGSLLQASDGKLYAMTSAGGLNNNGTIIQYDILTNVITKKFDFSSINGITAFGNLIQATDGMLYGMTSKGGANAKGVIFQFNPITNIYTKKFDFMTTTTGCWPIGSLTQASNGLLYGMTEYGGVGDLGVVFEYDFVNNIFSKKIDFNGTVNGKHPSGSFVLANNGMLYALTYRGGTNGWGVIFEYNPSTSTYTKKLNIVGGASGGGPQGTLIQLSNGKFYGVTYEGGNGNDSGVLFQYDLMTNSYTKKHNFGESLDGYSSSTALMEASNGKFYGTTVAGGPTLGGVLFEYDPMSNIYTYKRQFSSAITGGPSQGSLMQASDGKLYGMTYNNGPIGGGVLFQYDPIANIITNKVNFDGTTTGSQSYGSLLQASDGNLYGMTLNGGVNDLGVLFQYNPSTNVFTKKIDFAGATNGSNPYGSLIQASDGKLYGTTSGGGTFYKGTVFQYDITTSVLVKKVDFSGTANGNTPLCTLAQGIDGMLYGTTNGGGLTNKGVFFQYDPILNVCTKKYDFSQSTLGYSPQGLLLSATNGRIYGVTTSGTSSIFQYDITTNSLTKTNDFASSNIVGFQFSGGLIEVNFRIRTESVTISNCAGGNLLVPFKVLGTYNNGNNFTAQLSDASGSFLAPVNIGSISSITSNTINAVIPPGTSAGSGYRIRVVSNNPVIIGSDNGSNITINALPIPTITLNSGSICSGTNFTFTPSGASTYTYLNGGALVSPTVSTTYTVLGTDINGCAGSAISSVSVNPTPNITVNSGSICLGNSFSVAPNGAVSYTYSTGSSLITPTISITYTVNGEDNFGCIGSAIGNINVNTAPTITVSSGSVCSGQSFSINPSGASSYTFSGGSAIVSPTATTTYTVIGTAVNGCTNSVISSVTVNAIPTFTLSTSSVTTTCLNSAVGFSVATTESVLWSGPGTINPSPTVYNPTVTIPGIYTVTITDANTCTNTGTVAVYSNTTPPTFTLTPSTLTVCAGSSVSISANSTSTNSVSYLWDNSATTQSIVVNPSLTTVYTTTLTDNTNGCYSSQTTTVNVNALPTLTVTGTSSVCIGTSTGMISTGAMTYTWNTGHTTSSISVSQTANTTYTVWGTDMNGCTSTQTVSVTVDNTCADVWPGDANSDGIADNLDVLELGLYYTQTGAARASISNTWQSYFANNWTGTISNGSNLNHSDCNGDGIINNDDTLAIYNNYGLTHAFKPAQNNTVNPQLSIVPDQPMVVKGNWGTASVYLGDATTTINNINGLAFTVDFDNTLIESNSIYIEYLPSFIDASSNLYFRKLDFTNGKIYTATTHTVSNNVSGFGKIAILHYQILSSLATDNVLNIGISQANQSDASGSINPLTTGTGTSMAIGASVGLNDNIVNGNLSIHPNPTNGFVNIVSTNELQSVEVTTIAGQTILKQSCTDKSQQLQLQNFADGVYFVKVYFANGSLVVRKVVKQ